MKLDYRMYDADNHLYEATDAFTRHLPEHRQRDFYWITNDRGHRHPVVGGRVYDYIPNPTFDPVAVAGALDRRKVEPLSNRPEYMNRQARLGRFDEQGIEASLIFPTLATGLEEAVDGDMPLYVDLLRSYNEWLEEEWGFAFQDRIFATPIIVLSDVTRAVNMLEWVLEKGGRAIMLASESVLTPVGRRSPADPMFDPFWARCAEAGVVVCAHLSATGYNRYSGDLTGNYKYRPFQNHTLDQILNHGRPVADFFAAMVWQGAFTRHPGLRVVSIENRSDWVPGLLARFRHFYRPGALPEDPIDTFHRCVWVAPHWDEPIAERLADVPAERLVAGSDWPHYDSLAEPSDFAKYLSGLDAGDVRKVMRDNLRSLLVA